MNILENKDYGFGKHSERPQHLCYYVTTGQI